MEKKKLGGCYFLALAHVAACRTWTRRVEPRKTRRLWLAMRLGNGFLPPLPSHFAGREGRLIRWQPGSGLQRK
jgi:hypothetical protein